MLPALDAALVSLVRSALPPGTEVVVGAPTREWDGSRRGPAVNLFLHRVEEDVAARAAAWTDDVDGRGRVVARRPPSRRYRCCYLLTAWAADTAAEHALLAAVLGAAVGHVRLPEALQPDGLPPVALDVANPGLPAAAAELWSALGVPPRGCLDVVLTAVLAAVPVVPPGPPDAVDLGVARGVPAPARPPEPVRPRRRVRE